MIDFEEGAVCYADEQFWFGERRNGWDYLLDAYDFELNEPREGYYIPKSELDTEEKYNQAVEVFGLFGFVESVGLAGFDNLNDEFHVLILFAGGWYGNSKGDSCKVKLSFDQLIAIGELKRKMNERELSLKISKAAGDSGVSDTELMAFKEKPKRRNKSKQAYDILEGLDYEYDLVKQQWYKKDWV